MCTGSINCRKALSAAKTKTLFSAASVFGKQKTVARGNGRSSDRTPQPTQHLNAVYVPGRGLEPLRIAPPDPKSDAFSSFATLAHWTDRKRPHHCASFCTRAQSDAPDLHFRVCFRQHSGRGQTLRAFATTLTITEQRRADHVARVDTRYLSARMGVVYNKGFHLRLETKVGCMLTPFPSRRIVRPYAEV